MILFWDTEQQGVLQDFNHTPEMRRVNKTLIFPDSSYPPQLIFAVILAESRRRLKEIS